MLYSHRRNTQQIVLSHGPVLRELSLCEDVQGRLVAGDGVV